MLVEGGPGGGGPQKEEDVLKKVRVMNLRLMFPRPISRPVAAPQGPIRVM